MNLIKHNNYRNKQKINIPIFYNEPRYTSNRCY